MEIHRYLTKMYGESCMDIKNLYKRWTGEGLRLVILKSMTNKELRDYHFPVRQS